MLAFAIGLVLSGCATQSVGQKAAPPSDASDVPNQRLGSGSTFVFERDERRTAMPLTPAVPNLVIPRVEQNPVDYHTREDVQMWIRLGRCEQPGNGTDGVAWTHRGSYNGGLGILDSSWRAFNAGEPDRAYDATPAQQIVVARRIRDRFGWSAWACARSFGWH